MINLIRDKDKDCVAYDFFPITNREEYFADMVVELNSSEG